MKISFLVFLITLSTSAFAYSDDLLLGSFSLSEKKTEKDVPSNGQSFLVGSFDTQDVERKIASDEEVQIPQTEEQSFLQGSFQVK